MLSLTILTRVACILAAAETTAEDWPMWRYDAGRTAASPYALPDNLQLEWSREYTPREPVWDDPLNHDLMRYDMVFEPVVWGDTLFLGFNDSDKLVALDTATGEERWSFYVDGPVRLPPVVGDGRVLFASDDGCLYCLDVKDGALVWRFRGGPSDRKVLGNKRLISTWPARGGPVLCDGTVYFAASIWPFMGTFIYALDAKTGKQVWCNDGTSAQWIMQPHNYPAFAGVAPQGAFVMSGDRLLVPGGRSVAACFDRRSGAFEYYRLADNGKSGGAFVCAADGVFFNHHREGQVIMYDLANGDQMAGPIGRFPVLADGVCYTSGDAVEAYDLAAMREKPKAWKNARLWEMKVDASGDLIKAGDRLYAGGQGKIVALGVPKSGKEPKAEWQTDVEGTVGRLVAANGRLFAVTLEGRIFAFGKSRGKAREIKAAAATRAPSAKAVAQVKAILDATGVTEGYAFAYDEDDLLEALVAASKLTIIAVESDAAKIDPLRRRLDAAGLYGTRVAVLEGEPLTFAAPPYLASVTLVGNCKSAAAPEFLEHIFSPIRPYGGKAWLALDSAQRKAFLKQVEASGFPGATAVAVGDGAVLTREGPLPGAASWTHQYGDAANTVKSDDSLVKAPLGLLWFGGSSNEDVLPRHGHGPPEQVIGGRLFIEGMDCMSGRDVYSGRVLWIAQLGDLGTFDTYYDKTYANTLTSTAYNQVHIPGSNARGTNFVATLDKVYVAQGPGCVVLDAVTGERLAVLNLPGADGAEKPDWGYIGVYEDTLVGGRDFVPFNESLPEDVTKGVKEKQKAAYNFNNVASAELVVMDRNTGEVRWRRVAEHGFIHNGICLAAGMLFCLDREPPFVEQTQRRRGGKVDVSGYRLFALDLATGAVVWEKDKDVFGSWLGYSKEHDLLLQATRPSSDMLTGEAGTRMIAYHAKDGSVLWDEICGYNNPPILHGDGIITDGRMYNLLTGEPGTRLNALTGETEPWTYERTKGCNYSIASEYLLTFRSSAAGFYDLTVDGGTGHLGGYKSGCTPNLVAADGVLNSPDYTRTCSCSFQNQTSLALIYDPDVEVWTASPGLEVKQRIQRLGINLGAPGDRRDEHGTLWIEYPVVGGDSPKIEIAVKAAASEPEYLRHHSSMIDAAGNPLRWVVASGAVGLSEMTVALAPGAQDEKAYRVGLHFAELRDVAPGQCVFSVRLQGKEVLKDFDVVDAAGGPRKAVVRTFEGISVRDALKIELVPSGASTVPPLLCGVEMVADGA